MYRGRRYRKYGSKNKYMLVNRFASISTEGLNGYLTIISPTEITGKRKAKNFTITFSDTSTLSTSAILWALVYVPSGYTPNAIASTPTTGAPYVYEPSQNVIMCGLYDPNSAGNGARRFTRLSRTLNAGDGIALVYRQLGTPSSNTTNFECTYTYAITLN